MSLPPAASAAAFHTTRWTRVGLAQADSEEGRRALAELCDAYYEPVVAFLRCELRDADAARDTSHAFFVQMLAGENSLRTADRGRGRFRAYLLGAVKHFLSHQRAAAARLKRGGRNALLPLDGTEAAEVADARSVCPDAAFDRQWAVTVLARGLERLRAECQAEGSGAFFEAAKPFLTGDAVQGGQAALASACGMKAEALRMALHRLRKRLRHCVKAEVAGTLGDPALVEEEMQALFAALR